MTATDIAAVIVLGFVAIAVAIVIFALVPHKVEITFNPTPSATTTTMAGCDSFPRSAQACYGYQP